MTTSIIFYSIAVLFTGISLLKDRKKTQLALKKAYMSFIKLLPALMPMVLFVGIMLTLIPPSLIGLLLGDESGVIGIVLGSIIGSISFMPSFVAFSLGENLLIGGAGYAQVAVFISTLMAVGISSITVELKYFDRKLTIYRNVMAFIASIIFSIIIWVVMV